ncbi:oligopeptide ABC transporter substrate-binding protein OppA [Pectobacterium brasiliense]|uniref:oligopeptide ABC transporter substrate-binding protein OppA n=1 Tax=Pectobacterium brasiliense TaxID=180957 RepID=UPI001CE14691|nr:oligopeptide ABC transporter substrate-binding protein OppA [Pectobacterium brasiliense]MCA5918641.1 oligopeptide ABC transporter substrate-binding protein OppA [Pectobacterium brasiliense]MCA5925086.1 oligopeptide ABC transporter substrate-binding protein OppA [Pectobacterium brasiliense]MCA5934505.1 oligopeptide ABC transporter substrate-binding protein OppA [Pectobacterium brasiliense]MCA5939193.1 oligopeptide ABC transporter substrate-binding protein OppA [Pectobacterium brasiliense]MCA
MTHITTKKRVAAAIIAALSSTMAVSAFAATVPAGVQLAEKQELVRNNGAEVSSLDPHKIEGVPESNVSRDLLEGLVISDVNGKTSPGVAESWDNKDFKVWTFHLRKDAKWSNGEPVTAQDFVYSWQRLADPKTASPYASYLQYGHLLNIDDIIAGKKSPDTLGVKAIDDHTFEVTLSEAVPYFYKLPVYVAMSPVNKAAIEKFGEKWTQPQNWVGNGAYKLKSWVVNEKMVLERNPQYWDNAHTVINQVTYLPIASEVTDVNRYRSGEIDMTYNQLPIELFQKLKKEIPDEVKINPYLCTYYYEVNNQKPPFNDVRVRTALRLGLSQDILTNKVKNQGDIPAYGFVPPYIDGLKASVPEWFTWPQAKRNEEAKKLLAEAGYTADKPLTLNLLYNTSDLHKKMAIAAASIWKQNIGVDVKLENQEWKTFLSTRHQGTYDVARAGWCADYNEPSTFLNSMLSDSSSNTSHYKSKEFDALVAKSLRVKTDEERAVVYQQAEALLDKDAVTIPVYYYANTRLVKPYVGGLTGKDPQDNVYVKDLYIIKH